MGDFCVIVARAATEFHLICDAYAAGIEKSDMTASEPHTALYPSRH